MRETKFTIGSPWPVLFATLVALLVAVAPAAQATPTDPSAARAPITIDFSKVDEGPFDQSTFKDDGIVFTGGTFVAQIQGDKALLEPAVDINITPGPIAANVKGGFTSVSAQVAPALQGTATYTLTAFKQGKKIASRSMTVTQDQGDPATGPGGYFTISTGRLPKKADSFSLSNVFVRSSFPDNGTVIEFGVSSITLSG